MVRKLFSAFVLAIITFTTTFQASAANSDEGKAEQVRLQSEMERLIQRNAWKGVERTYQSLVDLEVELRPQDHLAGEQAARIRGDITEAYDRLSAAIPADAVSERTTNQDIQDAISRKEHIEFRYGLIQINVQKGRVPALVRFEWPFAREERVCIELGRTILGKDYSYKGLLPVGKYMVDGLFFEISAGAELLDIQVNSL